MLARGLHEYGRAAVVDFVAIQVSACALVCGFTAAAWMPRASVMASNLSASSFRFHCRLARPRLQAADAQ